MRTASSEKTTPRSSEDLASDDLAVGASVPAEDTAGTVLVEARTAQEALEQVSEQLGSDAEILNAERVLRGGVAGFFAREHVVLTARARRSTAAAQPAAAAGLDAVLARLAEDAESAEQSFSEALRRELDDDVLPVRPDGSVVTTTDSVAGVALDAAPAAIAAPAPVAAPAPAPVAAPAPAPAAAAVAAPAPITAAAPLSVLPAGPRDTSGVQWSVVNLRRIGLPASVTDAVAAQGPTDDLSWFAALARVLAPLCGPLPEGPALLVGPRALRMARPLGLPAVKARSEAVPPGSACLRTADSEAARAWIAHERGDRALHLVVGGTGWERLLFDEPSIVSWAGDEHAARAVALAAELGLVLGYTVDARGSRARRAAAVDVASALRAQLPRS